MSREFIPALPHCHSHPRSIQQFSKFAQITRSDSKVLNHAVFTHPIGFGNANDRKDWRVASGFLNDRHATFMEFYTHAMEMIKNEGKITVFGVVTYWTDPMEDFIKPFHKARKPNGKPWNKRSWYWSENCKRHGLGIAVCKMPKGQHGFRVIMYDMDHDELASHALEPNTGDEDRDRLIRDKRNWRTILSSFADYAMKDDLIEFWQAGNPQLLNRSHEISGSDPDSVSSSCAWLWDMVKGLGPSVDADDEEMIKWGYHKPAMIAVVNDAVDNKKEDSDKEDSEEEDSDEDGETDEDEEMEEDEKIKEETDLA